MFRDREKIGKIFGCHPKSEIKIKSRENFLLVSIDRERACKNKIKPVMTVSNIQTALKEKQKHLQPKLHTIQNRSHMNIARIQQRRILHMFIYLFSFFIIFFIHSSIQSCCCWFVPSHFSSLYVQTSLYTCVHHSVHQHCKHVFDIFSIGNHHFGMEPLRMQFMYLVFIIQEGNMYGMSKIVLNKNNKSGQQSKQLKDGPQKNRSINPHKKRTLNIFLFHHLK